MKKIILVLFVLLTANLTFAAEIQGKGNSCSESYDIEKEIFKFKILIQKKCTTQVPGVFTIDDTNPDDPTKNGCLAPYSNVCYQKIANCSSDDPTEGAYFLPHLQQGEILNCGYWNMAGMYISESLEVLTISNLGNYPNYTHDKLNIMSGIYIFTLKHPSNGDVYEVRLRKI